MPAAAKAIRRAGARRESHPYDLSIWGARHSLRGWRRAAVARPSEGNPASMTYYMLRPAGTPVATGRRPMTELEIEETTQAVRALEADLKACGAWVFGGRLHDPSTATVVRATG